jgi:hypothetical protein
VAAERGWQRKFEDPVPLPDGRKLVTLRDAATYATRPHGSLGASLLSQLVTG